MRTICLLRHAKSSWDHPSLSDHDRPLAPRGRKTAPLVGHFLSTEGLIPDVVLCSTAARTRETWDLVARYLDDGIPVQFDRELYGASVEEMLGALQAISDESERVLVVGHNPGTENLAEALAARGPSDEFRRLRQKFPTGALAVLEFEGPRWSDLAPGTCRLARFVRPKDLPDVEDAGA
jgi:phosphohistidine phosphatase